MHIETAVVLSRLAFALFAVRNIGRYDPNGPTPGESSEFQFLKSIFSPLLLLEEGEIYAKRMHGTYPAFARENVNAAAQIFCQVALRSVNDDVPESEWEITSLLLQDVVPIEQYIVDDISSILEENGFMPANFDRFREGGDVS